MDGPYRVIGADPAWLYRDKQHAGKRGAGYKYKEMRLADIKALPVATLAARDSYLFLWVTMPMLPPALGVMAAWGFEFVTVAFTWAKTTSGRLVDVLRPSDLKGHFRGQAIVEREAGRLRVRKTAFGGGSYTRANAEICMLGRRGKRWRESNGVRSLLLEPVTPRHSEKPGDAWRDRVVELCGDVPRIELFAREPRADGWHAWGNEIISPDVVLDGEAFRPA